jgi:hypothetical protein
VRTFISTSPQSVYETPRNPRDIKRLVQGRAKRCLLSNKSADCSQRRKCKITPLVWCNIEVPNTQSDLSYIKSLSRLTMIRGYRPTV